MEQSEWFILIIIVQTVLVVLLFFRLFQSEKSKRKVHEELDSLGTKVNDQHLETLGSKLNPHLFKNILNSIQSHAYQTYFALDKLANVLDYILYESQKNW